jgi:hypothetical protein
MFVNACVYKACVFAALEIIYRPVHVFGKVHKDRYSSGKFNQLVLNFSLFVFKFFFGIGQLFFFFFLKFVVTGFLFRFFDNA